ncbi:transcriptional regulator [Ensifer adhaerens]
MARVALNLGVRDLAALAKVAPGTVSRFEAGEELKPRTVEDMKGALAAAGVIFVEDERGEGVIKLRDLQQ